MNQPSKVKSPCIGVCALDTENICEGCFRSTDEITRWTLMSEQEQIDVINESWRRARSRGRVI